jgi:acyl-CoA reductase-like NAD-dependent aldehyde dehydrogenase
VITEATPDMAVMRDESFGPVIGITRVSSDDEAQGLMNDTDYGLTAAVYTRDRERARRILAGVEAGSVYWNCCDRVSPRLPWTGRGQSGSGARSAWPASWPSCSRRPGTFEVRASGGPTTPGPPSTPGIVAAIP